MYRSLQVYTFCHVFKLVYFGVTKNSMDDLSDQLMWGSCIDLFMSGHRDKKLQSYDIFEHDFRVQHKLAK